MKAKRGWSLKDGLNALFRRIHILVLILVLLPLGTLLACFLVTPVYETSARLMITTVTASRDAPDVATGREPHPDQAASPAVVASARKAFQSRNLWVTTVKRLGIGSLEGKPANPLSRRAEILLGKAAAILEGKEPARSATAAHKEQDYAITADRLSQNCLVSAGPEKGILDVDFRHDDPAMAQKILSTHVSEFVRQFPGSQLPRKKMERAVPSKEQTVKIRRIEKDPESIDRDAEANRYQKDYERAKRRLAEFKKQWKVVLPEKQKEDLYLDISAKTKSLRRSEAEISRVQELLNTFKSDPVTVIKQVLRREGEQFDSSFREAVSQLTQVMRRHETIKARFVENSRDFRDSQENVRKAQARVKELLDGELAAAEAKRAAIEAQISDQEVQLAQLEQRIEELQKLDLEVSVAKERYVYSSARKRVNREPGSQSTSLSTTPRFAPDVEKTAVQPQGLVAVKVLDPPFLPNSPLFPRKGIYILVSFILAVPLGLLMVAVATYFDRTFDSPEHVQEATGHRVLASFQRIKTPSGFRLFRRKR